MNSDLRQLTNYIAQQFQSGVSEMQIRQSLAQNNWDEGLVDQAFYLVRNPEYTANNPNPTSQGSSVSASSHKVRNGVLWIISPFIILMCVIIVNIIFRLAGVNSPFINILSMLAGLVGIIFIFVGPIIDSIKLTSKG